MIQGIYTPNLIPFRDDGTINESELRRMINWLIEKGIGGLYPNGSTGEFIRLIAEENRGRLPKVNGLAHLLLA
jgi:4-hydroxy-tetrahydrodipicolinate synthase